MLRAKTVSVQKGAGSPFAHRAVLVVGLHVLTNPLENGRAAWQHDIGVQILADVTAPRVDETWLEQCFLATVAAPDDATLANES